MTLNTFFSVRHNISNKIPTAITAILIKAIIGKAVIRRSGRIKKTSIYPTNIKKAHNSFKRKIKSLFLFKFSIFHTLSHNFYMLLNDHYTQQRLFHLHAYPLQNNTVL